MSEELKHRDYAVGLALFSDGSEVIEGWYCFNGMKPVRFSSMGVLPQNVEDNGVTRPVFWVTNANFEALVKLNSVGYVRGAFFAQSLIGIASETGISLKDTDRRESASELSKVLYKIWESALVLYPKLKPLTSLSVSIYEYIGMKDQPDELISPKLETAYQTNSSMPYTRQELGEYDIVLIPNRVRHVTKVLSYGQPVGKWIVQKKGLKTVKEILAYPLPVLAECDVVWKGSSLTDICAYGVSFAGGKNVSIRQWMSQAELLFISEHAPNIKILSTLTWESWDEAPQLPDKLYRDNYKALSYSMGIVADNFLTALKVKPYSKKLKKIHFIPRIVWLTSVDRAITFGQAKRLYDEGLKVKSYNSGTVTLKVSNQEIDDALKVASECGFLSYFKRGDM